jgi:hypothetical protein
MRLAVVGKAFRVVVTMAAVALAVGLVSTRFSGMMSMQGGAPSTESAPSAPGSEAAFIYLRQQNSNGCNLTRDGVMAMAKTARLQGACCSGMELASYQRQVAGLSEFQNVSAILHDPYDVPVALASRLLGYERSIQMDAQQQMTYDSAMQMTPDKGPCCCHCWRWDMTAGLARYLIARLDWGAPQVAKAVALTNGCGGTWEGARTSTMSSWVMRRAAPAKGAPIRVYPRGVYNREEASRKGAPRD